MRIRHGLGGRLLPVVFVAILPALALQTYETIKNHRLQDQAAERDARDLIAHIAEQQRQIVMRIQGVLSTLGLASAFRGAGADLCQPYLARLQLAAPQYTDVVSIGLDGRIVCAADPARLGQDLSDRAWFLEARDRGRFAVGGYSTLRNAAPVLPFALPLHDEEGRILGVLALDLDLGWLGAQLERESLPPGATALVADGNGIILARRPDGERFIGTGLPAESRDALTGVSDIRTWRGTGVDGVTRMIGYAAVTPELHGMYVSVGVDGASASATLAQASQRDLALLAFGVVAALATTLLGASRVIRRPISQLLGTARRWRRGDLAARVNIRTGVTEFRQLSDAFNEMAAALQARGRAVRTALESTTDSVIVLDRNWRYAFLNQHAIDQIAGGRDLIGQPVWEVFPDSADNAFAPAYREAVRTGSPTHVEAFSETLGRYFEAHAYPSTEGLTIYLRDITDLHRQELALSAAEAKATEILESIQDAFFSADAEWRFTYVNQKALDHYGQAREELLGRRILEVLPDMEGKAIVAASQGSISERSARQFETHLAATNRWVSGVVYPHTDGGVSVYFRDVTDGKMTEDKYRTSEVRLRLAVQATKMGIWEWDAVAGMARFDNRAAEILGGVLPAEQWLSTTGPELGSRRDALHPDDRERIEVALRDLGEGRTEALDIDYRLRRDGDWAWVTQYGVAMPPAQKDGKPARIVGVIRDVSDQYQADLERQEFLRTLDLATFMTRDLDGTITSWSRGCEIIYGWTAEEAVGAKVHELLHTVATVPLAEIDATLRRTGGWNGDLVQRRRDGAEIYIAARKRLRRSSAGHPISVVATLVDATALRHAQAELRRLNLDLESRVRQEVEAREAAQSQLAQAQKMQALGQLAGGIAHDFNNVLQAVSGAAMLIARGGNSVERVSRLARTAQAAADRGSSITSRLLAFSHHSQLQTQPLATEPILRGMRDLLAHTLGGAVDVRVVLPRDLPLLLADRGQLDTALVNLGTNARDAMPEGGTLTLSAAADLVAEGALHPAGLAPGRYVRIAVTDTGVGMDAATLARASEPFFTTKPLDKGTGLGLAMVRGFVEQSGGGIQISSQPGNGTTVQLWLPQAQEPPDRAEAPAKPWKLGQVAVPTQPATRVLLVDDDDLVRETIKEYLEDSGFIVQACSSGKEALAALDAGAEVDVLVTDLSMPCINGIDTIRQAHQRRPELPAVLLTGYTGERASLGAQDEGFLLLRKPVAGASLVEQIGAALGASYVR